MNENTDIHKLSWAKSIFKHGKWYLISSFITKGTSIFLLPIYTRYLSPADYGVLSSLNVIAQLLPIFISLYLDSAFGRFFHEKKNNHESLKELFSTIYWFVVVWGIILISGILFSSQFWIKGFLQVEAFPYAYLAFIPTLFSQIGLLGIIFLRQSLRAKDTTILQVITTCLGIGITIPLLILFKWGIVAKLVGDACVALFIFSFYTIYFYKNDLLGFVFNKTLLVTCLAYSLPLIPNIAGGWISSLSDRLIIAKYMNTQAVGLYSLGVQLAQVLYLAQDAITQVTGPISMSGLVNDKQATKYKIAKFSLFLLGFMLCAHLGLSFFSKEILFIFTTKSFYASYKVIAVFSFAYVLSSQYRIFTDIISLHKKSWIISSGAILSAISSLALNFMCIPLFGYLFAAYTLCVSTFIYMIWLFCWAQKLDPIPIYWKRTGVVFLTWLLGIYLVSSLHLFNVISLYSFSVKLLLFGTISLCILLIINKNKLTPKNWRLMRP